MSFHTVVVQLASTPSPKFHKAILTVANSWAFRCYRSTRPNFRRQLASHARTNATSRTNTASQRVLKPAGRIGYVCILLRLPTCAEKPVLMAVTLRRLPQELQVTKYSRFSPLLSSVSCDRQVLHATYSTILHQSTTTGGGSDVFTNVSTQHVFDLFLLESTFDDQTP